ncbi:MAG: S-layer homology domain-containing protein [Butyricicoccaceae bacterium]
MACASLGIVNGVGNGRFAPDAHITRGASGHDAGPRSRYS